jgi:nucleotide-binding universal stress UspA family protein
MKIVVGVDGGPQQPDAIALARWLASAMHGELVVATVYAWSPYLAQMDDWYADKLVGEAKSLVADAQQQCGDVRARSLVVADLSPPRGLHRLAEDEQADLVVLGASHRGRIGRAMLGSVAGRLIHGAPCAIAVAPRGYARDLHAPVEEIAVGYDGEPESDAALAWAAELGRRTDAALKVVSVVPPVPVDAFAGYADSLEEALTEQRDVAARRALDAALAGLPSTAIAAGEVLEGPVAAVLGAAAEGADLLVCGSRGYGPIGTVLLGSVARQVLHEAACPVVILPRTAGTPGGA